MHPSFVRILVVLYFTLLSLVSLGQTAEEDNYAQYWVVLADTGRDYQALQAKMYTIQAQLGIDIDTMGRYFNTEKNRIVLPDDDEDEMYAGEYYPRNTVSTYLSLDYLDIYTRGVSPETIGLVAGIYTERAAAKALLDRIQRVTPTAFVLLGCLYIGCMH